jgi:hypothetical protein
MYGATIKIFKMVVWLYIETDEWYQYKYYDRLEGHDVSQKTSVFWDVMLGGLVAN